MSDFWSWYVIAIVAFNILGCWALLHYTRIFDPDDGTKEGELTSHEYDGIQEYNNPLPRWWLWLFYITLVFGVVYIILYPGLGNYSGVLNWSMDGEYQKEIEAADKKYGPLFAKYNEMPIEDLIHDKQAMEMGQRIFVNFCFGCHGSDARGNRGYPNLTDKDWLYGGTPEAIKQSLIAGRSGVMPSFSAALDDSQIEAVVNYVRSLAHSEVPQSAVIEGKQIFATSCAACHGADGTGNQVLGAPNLTDFTWLYGGSRGVISQTIRDGRNGNMPAHLNILGEEKIHLVAAYVYSLSQSE